MQSVEPEDPGWLPGFRAEQLEGWSVIQCRGQVRQGQKAVSVGPFGLDVRSSLTHPGGDLSRQADLQT